MAQASQSHNQFTLNEGDTLAGSLPSSNDAYSTFIHHFSAQQQGGAPYLYHHFKSLHPNSAFAATQSSDFNFIAFANAKENNVSLSPFTLLPSVKLRTFARAPHRADGPGTLAEEVLFGAFNLTWQGVEYLIYSAQWTEGYQFIRQRHIVADDINDIDNLINAVSTFTTSIFHAILVFNEGYWSLDKPLYQAVQKASWSDVILDSDLKKSLKHEYTAFFKSENSYKDLGVPWKRGLMFLGPPGNGKTISLKAIMKDAGVPVLYVKSFHTYGGDEMGIRLIFERARAEAPCLLVLEDLDSLITENNRSFFLNELDGLEDNDGLLLVGTTNHFEKLDPALSNRPSRFDRKYTFPDPNEDERRQYALYWQTKLAGKPQIDFPDELVDKVAAETDQFSFAYLKEAFVATLILIASDEGDEPKPFPETLLAQIKWLRTQLGNKDSVKMFASDHHVLSSREGRGGAVRMKSRVAQAIPPVQGLGWAAG
ncbi:P-loop containing nucleoside triphosphate hydrolase protein [Meredithblackwellia eburnea MCA 4105]